MQARNRTWLLGSDPVERCRQRTMAIEGGDGSTLNLDFTTGVLDSRLTFNRSSTATFVNSSGYVEYAAHNLYYNTNFATITTGSSNPSLTGTGWGYALNSGTSFSATFNTNGSVTMAAGAGRIGLLRSVGFAGTGRRLIFSVDITSTGDTGIPPTQMIQEVTKTNETYYINGTLWTSGNVVGPCTVSFVFTSNPSGNASTYFGIGLASSSTGSATFANPRWGFYGGVNQLAYSPNTAATNANYLTAEYHAPRFDNELLTSRTNLVLQSNDFSTSPWVQKYGTVATLTSNYTVAGVPDGFSGTATRLQSSVAASGITQPLSLSAVSGKSIRFSLYIKSNTTADQFVLMEDVTSGGTVWTATPVWQRFQFSSLISSTKFGIEGLGAGLDISICGAQVEYVNTGAVTTAYIPTTTTQVSANTTEPRGLLIEGQTKNFMLQSQALSGLNPYGMIAISIDGTVPDPMGGAETKKIAADGTTALHAFLRFITADTATTVTVSIFAKKNGYKYLYLSEGTTNTAAARFNLETGVSDAPVVGAGYVSSKMTPYPNGWWRCEMVANITASSNRGWAIGAAPNSGVTYSVNGVTYLGSNNSNDGIYAFGWQVEAGSSASSYIPTGASQVTRTIDTCTISDANFSSWFVQGAGTLYAVSDVTKANTRNLVARIENTGATNYIEMGLNAVGYSTEAVAYQGASFTSAFTTYTPTLNIAYKSAYTWEAGRLDLAVNGVSPAAAGATLVTDLIRMGIGSSFGATDVWTRNGHIKQLKYYPMVMTDAQLNALTTP